MDEFKDRIIKLGAGNKAAVVGHHEDEQDIGRASPSQALARV